MWRFRRKKAEMGPYPGRPDPTPKGDRWVRVKNGVNVTDRISPEYARWLVAKIKDASVVSRPRVVDRDGKDVTEDYR